MPIAVTMGVLGVAVSPRAIAAITVGAPLLVWGVLAGAVPIVIHLIFRERPRRQVFPAVRFLLHSHAAATRAHRLKHLLLLLCRILLILLVVGCVMKLGCSTTGERPVVGFLAGSAPQISAVICVDTSASMGYRYQGKTRLRRAQSWARNLLEDSGRFGEGSQFAVVADSPGKPAAAWTADRHRASRAIDGIRLENHDRPVEDLLRQGYQLLGSARHEQRELYLLTDLTRPSWQWRTSPRIPESLRGLYVLDVGQGENRNVALSWPDVPDRVLPAGRPVTLPIRVRTGDFAIDGLLEVAVDGELRGRHPVESIKSNSEIKVDLALPAMTMGSHDVVVSFQPVDALECDNRRFAVVAVGEVPKLLIVRGTSRDDARHNGSDDAGDNVAALVTSMIAPSSLPETEQRYVAQPALSGELETVEFDGVLAVILADVAGLSEKSWRRLDRFVRAGGVLLVIPGPNIVPDNYRLAEALWPAAILGIADCPEPIAPAATELEHRYLKPFADGEVDSLNDRRAFKRLELGPISDHATVVVPFTDHQPALVECLVDRGRVILLAFSPARQWGQFGSQAGPMIVLLHTILENLAPKTNRVDSLVAGRAVTRSRLDLDGTPLHVAGPIDGPSGEMSPEPLPIEGTDVRLPTDWPGVYRLFPAGRHRQPVLHYSANVAETESDPARIDPSAVRSRFPEELAVVVTSELDALPKAWQKGRETVQWLVPLAVGLLGLLFVESLFANRFYGSVQRHIPAS